MLHHLIKELAPDHQKEWELLLLSIREAVTGGREGRVDTIVRERLDWSYLVETATRLRIHFFLYRSVCEYEEYLAGTPSFVSLQERWLSSANRAVRLFAQLIGLIALFRGVDIPAVPFKGVVLGDLAYGDYTLREFGDVDLLVDLKAAFRAVRLLESEDYEPEIRLDDDNLHAYIRYKNSMPFTCHRTGLVLDLHWEISARYLSSPLTYDVLAPRLETRAIEKKELCQMSVEETILYQSVHGARDCWQYMESVCSVAGIIRRQGGIDWGRLLKTAWRWRCERLLFVTLALARGICGVRCGGDIPRLMAEESQVEAIASTVLEQMIRGEDDSKRHPRRNKFKLLHFRLRKSWRERIRYAWYVAFSPTSQEWKRYPVNGKLTFLYYLLRPLRLFLGYVRQVLGGFAG